MMELKKRWNFRDDGTSKCTSFGSDNLPYSQSQSRKISIGVMVNEPLKGYKTRKEEKVAINEGGAAMTALQKGKLAEASKMENSPWVSTKSFHQETPTTNSVQFHQRRTFALRSGDETQKKPNSMCDLPFPQTVNVVANQTSVLQFEEGVQNQSNNKSEAPMTKTVQFYANRMSILQSSDGGQKKFDSITYERKEKGGRTERVEEFAFTAAKEVCVVDKRAEAENQKSAPQSNGSLKLKLWEILGTAPEDENRLNSQTLEDGVKNSRLGGNSDKNNSNVAKLRQNSDTIEEDSESPQETIKRPESPLETIKRPMTRSLTLKKTSSLANPKLLSKISNGGKLPSSSNHKQQSEEKSIFNFSEAEGWPTGLHGIVSGGTSSKKRGRKSTKVEPRRISFSGKAVPEKRRRAIGESKRPSPRKKATSHSNTTESSHSHSTQTNKESPQPAREKLDRQENLKTPNLREEENHHDNVDSISSKKNTQEDDVSSPGLEVKTPTENCSLSPPSAKTKKMQSVGRRFTSEGFCKLRTSQIFRPDFSGSDAETKSPDPTGELQKSPIKERSHVKEQDVEQNLSQSSKEQDTEDAEAKLSQPSKEQDVEDAEENLSQSSKEQDAESLEEDAPIKKVTRITRTWAPESGSPDKPKFMLRPRKRLCSPVSEFDPTPLSPKGTEESNKLQEPSYQDDEDGLARAVSLFAFALEKFKTRMKAETSKRSSMILASVTEGIKLQLQDINSQIQKDIGKFTGIGKSKRKRLETRFLEQQERLKLIQDKFKEEINQHIEDCKNTLDDLEAYQIELKENAEKQNASHRKLLLQVEGAIETQLSDAEQRIASIQQVANGNMLQLKRMIAECLKDGVFS
ncbi:hypothetical protein MKW98_003459 [Papaver atlanticum]|uniref:Meiosis-specific protein ASY3-like coiled-coil domain-containing protein n=1 Tax=Papaver atlanticum TaxID=357466 RepID=A0AAD4TCR1_9MAGN|nr:hypothetical protein MKW98_003459 [Papaver atlanticum]